MTQPIPGTLAISLLCLTSTNLSAAELLVPDPFPTIQSAVDAATDGDIIRVASGIYTEQVFVNRSGSNASRATQLTLVGEPGTILRAFEGMERLGPDSNLDAPIVSVFNSNLHVRGITFEGERLAAVVAPREFWLAGVQFNGSGGSVDGCHFHGFRDDGAELASAVSFFHDVPGSNPIDVRITNNTFVDVDSGIWLQGEPGRKTIDFTIEGNHITGAGPVSGVLVRSSGIEIRGGAGGVVRGNTITGFSFKDAPAEVEFPLKVGFLIFDGIGEEAHGLSPILVENNLFRNNQNHCNILKGDNAIIRNNTFEGTAPGVDPGALNLSGKDMVVESNRFSDMENGITLWGQHPTYGTALGTAENISIKNNQFSDVGEPIVRQRGTSDTESGTLIAPFPAPELDITRAVRVTWAGYADDYQLETSLTPNGPWSPAEADPLIEGNNLVVFIPTGSENQFFRLRQP